MKAAVRMRQKERKMATPASDVSSVFGSPPEPIFSESKHGLSFELLQDVLKFLTDRNEATMNRAHPDKTQAVFKSGNPVLFLFELCQRFQLKFEVQYCAAELFQRFMERHIVELSEHVLSTQGTNSPINWSEVETRLKHQVPLRAISCVQLASKLSSHYGIVSIGKAKRFLTACGYRYAAASIVQSEVRVLKTLNFQVYDPTPAEFVEGLLGVLAHNLKTIPVKQLHGVSLKVLDLFYICRHSIVQKRLKKVFPDVRNAAKVENNLMLLASAVLATVAYILDSNIFVQVTEELAHVSCIKTEDIVAYASALLEEINSDTEICPG